MFLRRGTVATAVWLALLPLQAAAQKAPQPDYPSKAIRVVVPYAAGGPMDYIGRTLGRKMAPVLGHQLVSQLESREQRVHQHHGHVRVPVQHAPQVGKVLAEAVEDIKAGVYDQRPLEIVQLAVERLEVGREPLEPLRVRVELDAGKPLLGKAPLRYLFFSGRR